MCKIRIRLKDLYNLFSRTTNSKFSIDVCGEVWIKPLIKSLAIWSDDRNTQCTNEKKGRFAVKIWKI